MPNGLQSVPVQPLFKSSYLVADFLISNFLFLETPGFYPFSGLFSTNPAIGHCSSETALVMIMVGNNSLNLVTGPNHI